jgi:hypothetical protein
VTDFADSRAEYRVSVPVLLSVFSLMVVFTLGFYRGFLCQELSILGRGYSRYLPSSKGYHSSVRSKNLNDALGMDQIHDQQG